MTNLIDDAASAATGLLGGIQGYLIAGGVALVIGLGTGAYGGYRWEKGTADSAIAAQVKAAATVTAKTAKVQVAQAQVAAAAAVDEANSQVKIQVHTVTVTKEIPSYVHDQVSCPGLTVGLARVLRSAADGSDPGTLQLAPGQSDDTCSDVTPSEVAGWFAQYAAAANGNAEQLNALEAEVKKQATVTDAAGK